MIDKETREAWRRESMANGDGPAVERILDRRILDLLDVVRGLEGTIERQLGDCIGCTTEPDECCPLDGRSITEWQEIARQAYRERTEVQEALDRVRALVDEWEQRCEYYRGTGNYHAHRGVTNELRAALDGTP